MSQLISLKNGEFSFKDLPIQDIMPTLERWYELSVNYQGQVNNNRYSLQVPRSTKLSKVLRILKKHGLHVTRVKRKVTINF